MDLHPRLLEQGAITLEVNGVTKQSKRTWTIAEIACAELEAVGRTPNGQADAAGPGSMRSPDLASVTGGVRAA